MLDKKSIGEKIKEARSIKGEKLGYKYTGKMLADELNVSRSYLGDIESGRTAAPNYLLQKIIFICELPDSFFKDNTVNLIKEDSATYSVSLIPEEFTIAAEARVYIKKHKIFASEGFNVDKLTDDEVLEFANALLEQMRLVSYKFKK